MQLMPFGLCNAPATFQSYGIYFDTIIIFSDTFENHISRLDAVFQRLHQNNPIMFVDFYTVY